MRPVEVLGEDSLRRSVREAGITAEPVWFDSVGSTNAEALRLAEGGAPAWTVVAAGHQTAGRGRRGRGWVDAPRRSLLCSVVLRPAVATEEVPLLSLAAAVAVIEAAGLPAMRSKWPNDLVVGERKCGGILAEGRVRDGVIDHVVLGLGVNLSLTENDFPADLRGSATSLQLEGAEVDAEGLLSGFLARLRAAVEAPEFPGGVVGAYRDVCDTIGRRIRATSASGRTVEGRALDLDERGALVVDGHGGRETVAFGEVTHVR